MERLILIGGSEGSLRRLGNVIWILGEGKFISHKEVGVPGRE